MHRFPPTSRRCRLAAAVTVVLTATLGALALPVPAGATPVAAPDAVPAAAAQAADDPSTVPNDLHVVSAGHSGFLGRRSVDGVDEYRWTSYADGTSRVLPSRTEYSGGRSDFVVGRRATETRYTLYDMSDPDSSVGLTYGDPRYTLAGVAGQSLVMSRRDADGVLDVFLMSRPSGSTSPTTHDVALPTDARLSGVRATTPDTVLLQYTRGAADAAEHYLAAVDLPTGQIIETVPVGTTAPRTGIALSETHFAWIADPTGTAPQLVTVLRGGGERTSVPLGTSDPGVQLDLSLVGGWAVYTQKGGGTAGRPSAYHPLQARSLSAPGTAVRLLDHVDSAAAAPDGSLLVRGGQLARGEGVFRIAPGGDGRPAATLVASTGAPTRLELVSTGVPSTVALDADGGSATLTWVLSRNNAHGTVTLRHVASGRKVEHPVSDWELRERNTVTLKWNGLAAKNIGDMAAFAPSGAYVWELKLAPYNGIGPELVKSGTFDVTRRTNPHDYTANSSPDLLARDSSGGLFLDDTVKVSSSSEVYSAGRTRIGTGWGIYNQLEAVGDIAGGAAGDVVARDASGVLWSHLGKGDGIFAPRTKIGGGWNAYDKITGGSDLSGDGRADLLATDTSGVLWYYRSTNDWKAPFAGRVRVGGGWGVYNQITAVGDIAGSTRGDLVARDTAGVLWLHQGSTTGQFSARVRVGGGWGSFTHLIGVGDADRDGRDDLYAVGPSGSRLYAGTGSATVPFAPAAYTSVNSDAARFNSVF
ncbi:VCBS repeat-containing protein [Streptomyces zaomyceticus]|uniref:VCBS repeat-containing protein n=1 Tax=Streptomyces zaomyceticus TaxID=68286 RepID=UPI0037B31B34